MDSDVVLYPLLEAFLARLLNRLFTQPIDQCLGELTAIGIAVIGLPAVTGCRPVDRALMDDVPMFGVAAAPVPGRACDRVLEDFSRLFLETFGAFSNELAVAAARHAR